MAADFRIRPLADRVVIKPADREEKTKGGIFLPDTASKERPMEGTVLAVGAGRLDDNGKRVRHVKTTGRAHAESSNRYQKKADNQIRANLREAISKLKPVMNARHLHRLVLAGTPETAHDRIL